MRWPSSQGNTPESSSWKRCVWSWRGPFKTREVARSIGVSERLLHHWKHQALEKSDLEFPGSGNRAVRNLESEIRLCGVNLRR
ncbi:MAG: transposase [Planctomycetota bacterium]